MKTALLILGTMIFASTTFAAEGIKFKTLQQVMASGVTYVTCTGRRGTDQVVTSLQVDRISTIGVGFGIKGGGISIVTPNEGLYLHEWNTQMFQMGNLIQGQLEFSGQSYSVHSDSVKIVLKDATNGKFKGTLHFNDMQGLVLNLEVSCVATNYATPKM